MAEIVNLRRARKRKAARDADTEAAANRLRFGASKSEKKGGELAKAAAERRLDGHRRVERADDE